MTTTRDLLQIADERLADAEALLTSGRYTGAVYISGYVLECLFKALVCKQLGSVDVPAVLRTSATHQLENLLELIPAIESVMKKNRKVKEAYARIMTGTAKLRYSTHHYRKDEAEIHMDNVKEVKKWLLQKL